MVMCIYTNLGIESNLQDLLQVRNNVQSTSSISSEDDTISKMTHLVRERWRIEIGH